MILQNAGSRSSSHQGALSAGLSALAQPFKLRMARSPHETQLWDYSTNVVLIEPLASLQAVEDFLWPRVFRTNPPPEARGGANAAAAQAAATARKSSRSTSTRSKCGKGEEQVCCLLAVTFVIIVSFTCLSLSMETLRCSPMLVLPMLIPCDS